MNGGKVYGRLTLEGDEHPIPIRDRRMAEWVAAVIQMLPVAERNRVELADYRVAWQELTTRHNRLERSWWCRLGRRLRLAPSAKQASQSERRVVASEVRLAMEQPGVASTTPNIVTNEPPSANGNVANAAVS